MNCSWILGCKVWFIQHRHPGGWHHAWFWSHRPWNRSIFCRWGMQGHVTQFREQGPSTELCYTNQSMAELNSSSFVKHNFLVDLVTSRDATAAKSSLICSYFWTLYWRRRWVEIWTFRNEVPARLMSWFSIFSASQKYRNRNLALGSPPQSLLYLVCNLVSSLACARCKRSINPCVAFSRVTEEAYAKAKKLEWS